MIREDFTTTEEMACDSKQNIEYSQFLIFLLFMSNQLSAQNLMMLTVIIKRTYE
jgi:hypothetical protein